MNNNFMNAKQYSMMHLINNPVINDLAMCTEEIVQNKNEIE